MLIAGGGTGGHLFPAIAIAEELKARGGDNEVLFVGTTKGIEGRVLPERGWAVRYIAAEGIKGKGLAGKVKGMLKLLYGAVQSMGVIRTFRPGVVLGVGGYASAPAVLAGRLMGIRSAIHEQNAMPGLTNRVLGKVVDRVFLTCPESGRFFSSKKVEVTGNPVRREILQSLRESGAADDREERFTLFIFGGSRGARRINEVAVETFCGQDVAGKDLKVIHQTGDDDYGWVVKSYEEAGVDAEVYPFISDMASAYMRADIVICRAGATTISELLAAGKPSILIPYPFAADDHQRLNAEAVAREGAARMVPDGELDSNRLSEEVGKLFNRRALLEDMGKKAEKLSKSDAAGRICDGIIRMAA